MTGRGNHGIVTAGVSSIPDHFHVVDWAAAEAARRGAALRLVHAHREPRHEVSRIGPARADQETYGDGDVARATLDLAVERARSEHPNLTISGRLVDGDVVKALAAQSHSTDFLAVGARDRSWFAQVVFGSFAGSILDHAECPVVVVPPAVAAVDPLAPVVVGVSNGPLVLGPLGFAFNFAADSGRPLHVVHCWRPPVDKARREFDEAGLQLRLSTLLADFTTRYPEVDLTERVVPGDPASDDLVWRSGQAALVVVGSRERRADSNRVLGPVSSQVLRAARCPVAVVRTLPERGDVPLTRSIGHGLWFAPDPRSSRELG